MSIKTKYLVETSEQLQFCLLKTWVNNNGEKNFCLGIMYIVRKKQYSQNKNDMMMRIMV